GLPPERFVIDATDISAQALGRAREGVYGKNSFRGADLGFRDRHFSPTPEGLRISDAARASVRFKQTNLLAVDGLGAAESYDVVFCRNLLIYFDADTQQRAIQILRRLLSPEGLLFVGPGEANLMLGAAFTPAQIPLAFAFKKAAPVGPPAKTTLTRDRVAALVTLPAAASSPRPRAFNPALARPASNAVAAKRPGFADIRRLADEGRLAEATKACEEHLRKEEPAAEAWRLLGLLRDASGELDGAAECYRKALYLDPTDRESLGHLALLLQRQGDVTGAKRVSARALRRERKDAVG
ncbi:MAG: wspC, partial [Caulobacteraceae bacterium]|nr:wspC [Caulobacteraceae bacterium]